ncbi:MAG TPA: tripartite tricarboxylate transporter substrate-binding protein, partial [Xanthobacteraceae bacterium]|nr:tripartite tricarboxylate transporter substrate-binding protein [Xanthobacteraceae bacterium]
MFRFLLVALAMLMLMGAGNTQAQSYPDRVIKVICAFAPGSGADILVRYYAHKLGEISKASVIVENRTGAQGNIGTEFVARAKPDGYTILITANTA